MSETNGHCGIQVVRRELLEALAAQAPAAQTPATPKPSTNGSAHGSTANGTASSSNGTYTSRLMVDRWLQDRGIAFRVKPQPDGRGRTVYILKQCVFDQSHGDPDSCIMQAPAGKLSAQCFHNSCSERGWQDFKAAIGRPESHHYDPPLKRSGHATVGKGGRHPDTNGQSSKPIIMLDTEEYRISSEAIEALSNSEAAPEVYQRGNLLVRVIRAHKAGKQSRLNRANGTPRIATMPKASLCGLLTRIADFRKVVPTKDGDVLLPAHPPDRTVAEVLAREQYQNIRGLEAVIEAPTLRPDGTILDTPGWDDETGLLYAPNADFPPIPQTPSRGQAMAAADRLLDLVGNFPFAGESEDEKYTHRAAWLAGLLTTLARFAIDGPCPLFLFDANCPGTGKSMLSDIIAIIAAGRDMSRTAFPDEEAELRKRITSIVLAGDRMMLFDNIAQGTPFGGASLDAALTGTTWQDRLLGKNELTPELPLYVVWFATGNNVVLKGDVQRRVIPCRLETKEEKPEERDNFRYPNLLEHVRGHRPQLLCDALTIIRAYMAVGSPQAHLPAFGSYEAWSRLIRQAVFWVMEVDPFATRERIRAADPTLANLACLTEGWSELPGGKTGITVAEALRILNDRQQQDNYATLRGALMEWTKTDMLPGSGVIGCRLRSLAKRVINKRMLNSLPGHGGLQKWLVTDAG